MGLQVKQFMPDLMPEGPDSGVINTALRKGDILVAVNGQNVRDAAFDEAMNLMRTISNEVKKLTFARAPGTGKTAEYLCLGEVFSLGGWAIIRLWATRYKALLLHISRYHTI